MSTEPLINDELAGSPVAISTWEALNRLCTKEMLGRFLAITGPISFIGFYLIFSKAHAARDMNMDYVLLSEATAEGLCLYSFIAYPLSLACLWAVKKPLWIKLVLIPNSLFFAVQILACTFSLLIYLFD